MMVNEFDYYSSYRQVAACADAHGCNGLTCSLICSHSNALAARVTITKLAKLAQTQLTMDQGYGVLSTRTHHLGTHKSVITRCFHPILLPQAHTSVN